MFRASRRLACTDSGKQEEHESEENRDKQGFAEPKTLLILRKWQVTSCQKVV